jgi:hypothetical protein
VSDPTLLRVVGLRTWFPVRAGILQRPAAWVRAVDDVSFEIEAGRTLALAAGELVRVAPHLARIELHALHQRRHARGLLGLARADPEGVHALGDDVAHAHARVERRHRILEHDLESAAQRAQRLARLHRRAAASNHRAPVRAVRNACPQ